MPFPWQRCLCLTLLGLPAPAPAADTSPAGQADHDFFEKEVRPVLVKHCFRCHGPDSPGRGGLRLDSRAALLSGGERGPAVAPGKPDESLLVRALRHDGDLQMPPRKKLPAREVAALTAWVRRGAPWPGKATPPPRAAGADPFTPEEKAFWAFRPPTSPPVPAVKDRQWVRSPLDAFLLAGLEARGLRPAPPADRRTLIRRVTFDLTGLPPTPEAVRAFLADTSPDAYERLVDRLLASPAYGEKWGRHWLDVARYADSNGMDENLVQAHAWRYRDHVIAAFNADLPYDRFVAGQLAGDLLPDSEGQPTVATGFLSLGPKMLAEDDPVKMQMDIVDEQIDTVGRAFMGLTLGCARCHDHKFDPIPTEDYYALAGIFKSTQTMDHFKVVARWHERPVGSPEQVARLNRHEEALAARRAEVARIGKEAGERLAAEARRKARSYLEAAADLLRHEARLRALTPISPDAPAGGPPGALLVEAEDYARGNVKRDAAGYGKGIGVIYNAGPLPNVAEYDLTCEKPGPYRLEIRYAAAEARPVRLSLNGDRLLDEAAGRVTGGWYPDHQQWAVEAVVSLRTGKNTLRLERDGPFPHFDRLALVPWKSDEEPPQTADRLARDRKLRTVFLKRWARHLAGADKPPEGPALDKLVHDPEGPFALSEDLESEYPKQDRDRLNALRRELADLEKATPALPLAMAVAEGEVADVRIHRRGSHLTLGAEVPRRFLRILTRGGQEPLPAGESGRRQLAAWLTRPDHPLTARVMVNRVWHWHFGQGIVRTPDNFGRLGDRPADPALLDWLAVRFVADGWSIKALHRLILLSGTYRMSTRFDPRAAEIDPDNRLLWRRDRRRLDAEELRDALLSVGGQLDRTMGGSLMRGENRAYVPGYPNTSYDGYDTDRRSVYLPVIRSDLYAVFQAFDFADPSTSTGVRSATTVAPQALFLMNGKLAREQTRRFAADLLGRAELDDRGRLGVAYARAYGRPPAPDEVTRAEVFLRRAEALLAGHGSDESERRLGAWQSLCRVLVSANEFLYVE